VLGKDNISALKSELLNALLQVKAGTEETTAVEDALPEEDEVIPDAHKATIEKLRSAAAELVELESSSDIEKKVDEMIALAESLPGEFSPGTDGDNGDSGEDEEDSA
jgi:hypothetical protein